jgi:hypothetical protein
VPDLPVPDEGGPRLGALANLTPVLDRPSRRGIPLGYLHGGQTVARADEPFSLAGCAGGWYAVRPRGLVCVASSATLDLDHPTLVALSVAPDLTAPLPYPYARAVRDTTVLEADPERERAVRTVSTLRARSGLAVVGSWSAADPTGKVLDLAMTTDGRFVPSADLEAVVPSRFAGADLRASTNRTVAFIAAKGSRTWALDGATPHAGSPLPRHGRLLLTGRGRRVAGIDFREVAENGWVRARDVTVVPHERDLPRWATGTRKWIDVDVSAGTLVAYEGAHPVLATLVSVRREPLGAAPAARRGDFEIVAKHVTAVARDPASFAEGIALNDVPWAIELSSGQFLAGAYWHDRFGTARGLGHVELTPVDAARLFHWVDPALPDGWHAVRSGRDLSERTLVVVRD